MSNAVYFQSNINPESNLVQKQHHFWEAPQGGALPEDVGGVRPLKGPGDPARRRPDGDRGEGNQPLGRPEAEDQCRTVNMG